MTSRANGRHNPGGRSVVYIDGDAMYQRMGEMNRRLGDKNDTLIRVETEFKAAKTGWGKVEERVSRLEPKVWAFPSLTGLIGLAALVVSIVNAQGG